MYLVSFGTCHCVILVVIIEIYKVGVASNNIIILENFVKIGYSGVLLKRRTDTYIQTICWANTHNQFLKNIKYIEKEIYAKPKWWIKTLLKMAKWNLISKCFSFFTLVHVNGFFSFLTHLISVSMWNKISLHTSSFVLIWVIFQNHITSIFS